MTMLNVGLIGYGTAGKDVAEAILGGQAGDTRLAAVLVRDAAKYADVALGDCLITDSEAAFFERRPDVVVETAGHAAVFRYAEAALSHGCDFMVVSVGAFATRPCSTGSWPAPANTASGYWCPRRPSPGSTASPPPPRGRWSASR
ncbi:hypothetical protein [Halomonas sp. E19]|uniref:hypothetical protein n=1 Tax=Halomonas sp. E19 TaxID=3397247 RepID=UPI004033ABBA